MSLENPCNTSWSEYRIPLIKIYRDHIVRIENECRNSFVNPKTTEILNYNEGELIGKHWYSIIAAEDLEKAEIESANRPNGINGTYELKLLTKDGKIVPTIITATPVFSEGKFEGVLCVFTDITWR